MQMEHQLSGGGWGEGGAECVQVAATNAHSQNYTTAEIAHCRKFECAKVTADVRAVTESTTKAHANAHSLDVRPTECRWQMCMRATAQSRVSWALSTQKSKKRIPKCGV